MATKSKVKDFEGYKESFVEALRSFDLKTLKSWMRINNYSLYRQFKINSEEEQKTIMSKWIVNRSDLFNTEAFKKAQEWLKSHNTKGGFF